MATPMSNERFLDRWEAFKGEPQQVSGAWMLCDAIRALEGGGPILDEQAPWALKFSEPPASVAPPLKIDGMIGPKAGPASYGFQAGDHHLVVNDRTQKCDIYDFAGKKLHTLDALARGQAGDTTYTIPNSDTPPGLYKFGAIYNDYAQVGANPAYNSTLASYGYCSFDMVSLDGAEEKAGRAGIMTHGGGSSLGWPGAWAAMQPLVPTLGCVRMHNSDLLNILLPLTKKGTVFMSVYQEA